MKKLMNILFMMIAVLTLSSCFAGMFEEEIKVNFVFDGEYLSSDTLTQFKNIHTPVIDETYVYYGYKFYGWTPYNPDTVSVTDENFKEKFIGDGKMVHYMDVKKYAKDGEVTLNALMIDKATIPVVYHYVVIAWYDKEATSGLTNDTINTLKTQLFEYLRSEGVSEEDLSTIVIRGYTGNVGASCGSIIADEDVDIMLGWGSASNVIGTGGMKESMLLETESLKVDYNGTTKNRTIHRLTDSESVIKVMEWLKSESGRSIFHEEG